MKNIYVDNMGVIRSKVVDDRTIGYAHMFLYKIPLLRNSHLLILLNNVLLGERLFELLNLNHLKNFDYTIGGDTFPFVLELKDATPEMKFEFAEKMLIKERYFRKLVTGMNELAIEKNIRFLIALIPMNFQAMPAEKIHIWDDFKLRDTNYFDILKPWLSKEKIEYYDILTMMKETPGEYFPVNGELHFTTSGHRAVAKGLKQFIDEHNWVE